MTTRAKAEARKARAIERKKGQLDIEGYGKAMLKAVELTKDWTDEQTRAVNAQFEGMHPCEVAKHFLRLMLADEVCEKIKTDLPNEPVEVPSEFEGGLPAGFKVHAFADIIDGDNVVEMIEGMVEGDAVLDDATVHQWFRKKLDNYRDQCIDFDNRRDELEALSTIQGLAMGFVRFDVLVDSTCALGEIQILVNDVALAKFVRSEPFADAEWFDVEGVPDWRFTNLVGPKDPSVPKRLATGLAKATGLRCAVIKKYGILEAITEEEDKAAGEGLDASSIAGRDHSLNGATA